VAEPIPARPEDDREHESYDADDHQDDPDGVDVEARRVVVTAQAMIAPAAIIRRLTAVSIGASLKWWFDSPELRRRISAADAKAGLS
jgi:hypothetical protein